MVPPTMLDGTHSETDQGSGTVAEVPTEVENKDLGCFGQDSKCVVPLLGA